MTRRGIDQSEYTRHQAEWDSVGRTIRQLEADLTALKRDSVPRDAVIKLRDRLHTNFNSTPTPGHQKWDIARQWVDDVLQGISVPYTEDDLRRDWEAVVCRYQLTPTARAILLLQPEIQQQWIGVLQCAQMLGILDDSEI